VVVIGGSGVGLDVSLFLAEKKGKKVTVVEMLSEMGGDLNELIKPHIFQMAEERGIKFQTNAEVIKVEKGKVHLKTLLGAETLACDTIVSAAGFASHPTDELRRSLEKKGIEVRVIGSALEPGRIFEATQSGFWAGAEL
jgi:pyruvate/2-oxoglutarate dehydrogenase complex dihydrolipoamide dehydrogenase (E3) component